MADISSFEETYRSLTIPLIRFACRVGVSLPVAEEIVGDVFADLWERRDNLPSGIAIKPYLYRAVRNRALNSIRGEKREDARHSAIFTEDDVDFDFTAAVEHEEAQHLLQRYVDALPERQRTVLILRYTREMPLAEVAQIMELSIPAVKMLLQRATRALRESMGSFLEDFS